MDNKLKIIKAEIDEVKTGLQASVKELRRCERVMSFTLDNMAGLIEKSLVKDIRLEIDADQLATGISFAKNIKRQFSEVASLEARLNFLLRMERDMQKGEA